MKIAIVDPYTTGHELAVRLHECGHEVVHIDSGWRIPSTAAESYVPRIFTSRLGYEQATSGGPCAIQDGDFDFVVAGSESGVFVADELSQSTSHPMSKLGLLNKNDANRRLQSSGIDAPNTYNDVETALTALSNDEIRLPVVVKPLWSATGDNVKLCHAREEIEVVSDDIVNSSNIYGAENKTALVQEFMPGHEYVCNLVSYNGRHRAIEVWQYEKALTDRGGWQYTSERYVDPNSEMSSIVSQYCINVLNAIGFLNGAVHAEVMVDGDRVRLVEVNYRLEGTTDFSVIEQTTGTSQLKAWCEAIHGGNHRLEHRLPRQNSHMGIVKNVFFRPVVGGLVSPDFANAVRSMAESFHCEFHKTSNGRDNEDTLLASPGYVFLTGGCWEVVEKAEARIRDLEDAYHE